MTREQLEDILKNKKAKWNGDNAIQGLLIINKYFDSTKKTILEGAEHDIIYSVRIEDIIEAGLTEEDANKLAELNWMTDEDNDCLACFV